jgi:hypothetical protein
VRSWQHTCLRRARQNSARKGLPTPTISVEWIAAQPLVCPFLGLRLIPPEENTERRKGERHPNSPSLDRLDPEEGYTPDNTVLTSWFWNQARNDLSVNRTIKVFHQIDCCEPKKEPKMHPTKRQIAKVLRQTARIVPKYPRMTNALFQVCKAHGSKASVYYDNAVLAVKAHTRISFSKVLNLPAGVLQKEIRRTARALEHGLQIQ